MDFQCSICNQHFGKEDDAIAHLKIEHSLEDNSKPIKCIVVECQNSYLSFKALKTHLKNSHQRNVQKVNIVKSFQVSNALINFNCGKNL